MLHSQEQSRRGEVGFRANPLLQFTQARRVSGRVAVASQPCEIPPFIFRQVGARAANELGCRGKFTLRKKELAGQCEQPRVGGWAANAKTQCSQRPASSASPEGRYRLIRWRPEDDVRLIALIVRWKLVLVRGEVVRRVFGVDGRIDVAIGTRGNDLMANWLAAIQRSGR